MTDKNITVLSENTAPADGDLLYCVDVSDTTDSAQGTSKYIQQKNARAWPQTAAESAAGVTPTNYQYGPGNVLRYGATGDGSTDDGAAITSALNAAITSATDISNHAVYFPTGVYRVTTDGILSSFTQTSQQGILMYGDGKQSSIIMVDPPSTSNVWIYNNDTADKMQQATFRDLGFMGKNATTGTPENSSGVYADISQYAKGFRINNADSSLHEGRFHFHDCWFGLLDQAVEFSGTGSGSGGLSDECSFVSCQFNQIRSAVLTYNNNQAIGNNFSNCAFSRTYSHVISLTGNGGGPSNFTGCSFIMTPDSATTPADSFILHSDATGMAQNSTPFTFVGCVSEIRGTYGKILEATTTTGTLTAIFKGCRFLNNASADKRVVDIVERKSVKFDDCVFVNTTVTAHQQFRINSSAGGMVGEIKFIDCYYPESRTAGVIDDDLSDNCFVDGTYGVITATGTRGGNGTTGSNEPAINSQDFTMGGSSTSHWLTGHTNPTLKLHSIQCKRSSLFPEISSSVSVAARESTVRLPKNSIIKNIYAYQASQAYSSSVTDYQMRVTNDDGSVVHCISSAAVRDAAHEAKVTDYFYDVGATENERNLRLDCIGTGTDETDKANGYWVVEYY